MQLGLRGLTGAIGDLKKGNISHMGTHLARILADPGGLVEGAIGIESKREHLVCVNVIEQSPNPDSRVSLTTDKDALGLPRIALDWQLSELERGTLAAAQSAVKRAFEENKLGEMRPELFSAGANWDGVDIDASAHRSTAFTAGHHHTGTTRMGSDPKSGVVDANCKVYGVGNLYVAGSSVFPTLGSANPTLTIVAMALRLADHLSSQA